MNEKYLQAKNYFQSNNNNPELNIPYEKAVGLYEKLCLQGCAFVSDAIDANNFYNVKVAMNTAVAALQEPIYTIQKLAIEALV